MGSCDTETSGAVHRTSVMLSPKFSEGRWHLYKQEVILGGNTDRLLDAESLASPLFPLGHFLLNKMFFFLKCLPSLLHVNSEVSSFE